MLNKKPTLKDLESIDPEFYNSILWVKSVSLDSHFHPHLLTSTCTSSLHPLPLHRLPLFHFHLRPHLLTLLLNSPPRSPPHLVTTVLNFHAQLHLLFPTSTSCHPMFLSSPSCPLPRFYISILSLTLTLSYQRHKAYHQFVTPNRLGGRDLSRSDVPKYTPTRIVTHQLTAP